MITFCVSGEPIPQGSHQAVTRGNRAVVIPAGSPERERAFEQWRVRVRAAGHAAMREAGASILETPAVVELTFLLARPASVSVAKRPLPSVKPDIDKLARAVLDAITSPPTPRTPSARRRAAKVPHMIGPCLADDSLVVDLVVSKRYAVRDDPPGVIVRVRPFFTDSASEQLALDQG